MLEPFKEAIREKNHFSKLKHLQRMLKQFVCGVERRVTNVGGHSINILGWTKEQHSCVLYNILLAGLGGEGNCNSGCSLYIVCNTSHQAASTAQHDHICIHKHVESKELLLHNNAKD